MHNATIDATAATVKTNLEYSFVIGTLSCHQVLKLFDPDLYNKQDIP